MKKIKGKKLLKQIEYDIEQDRIICPLFKELKNLAKRTEDESWFKVKKGDEDWYKKIKIDGKTWYKLNENQLTRGTTVGREHRIKNPILNIKMDGKVGKFDRFYYKVQCNECGQIMEGRFT